jgi:hypothetical protein
MNWSIRITIILLIVAGLVWLNWDRFHDDAPDLAHSERLEIAPESKPESSVSDTDVGREKTGEVIRELAEPAPAVGNLDDLASQQPQFDLQAAPDSLDQSDQAVLSVAGELSSAVLPWLKSEQEQIRKWTLLIKQAAEGKTLYQDRPFVLTMRPFLVEEKADRYFISPENFIRYDGVVNALVNLPAEKVIAYYRAWNSLFEEAFSELGLPGGFDDQIRAMLNRLLKVSIIDRPIELKEPTSVNYKFMEPELERATQIEKWLWRMGPENTRKIQELADRLKRALDNTSQIR